MAPIADVMLVSLVTVFLMSGCHGIVRDYYIATRDIVWDYRPDGRLSDLRDNGRHQPRGPPENKIGHVYYKTSFFQYTDQTFTREVPKPDYLGILGPVIAGEVGDIILVHFFNNASRSYSIHTHGVLYDKRSEGSIYLDGTGGKLKLDDGVPPGGRITLRWEVTVNDAPAADDPNCLPWAYHSHVNSIKDVATGLFGVMITCKSGVLNQYNRRTDVDADYPLVVMNWNENLNFFLEDNIRRFCPNPLKCRQLSIDGDQHFIDSNIMKSINGRSYGTLPGLRACTGDRVVFYVIGFGNEADVHSIHFHGQNVHHQHTRGDTISVYSATFIATETSPTQPGDWLITDMVGEYEKEGIFAKYLVRNCGRRHPPLSRSSPHSITRRYYITVEEGIWNYAPSGVDERTGRPVPTVNSPNMMSDFIQGSHASSQLWEKYDESFWNRWRQLHTDNLGSYYWSRENGVYYKKARFVQYEDDSFKVRTPTPVQESHLGTLGPVIGAEVGDKIFVTLRNTIQFPVSFLPHGLTFNSTEESRDGPDVPGGAVGTNQVHTYRLEVPDDLLDDCTSPCRNFLYTSSHDQSRDRNAGLVGPLLICRKGYLSTQNRPKEFFILFSIIDEGRSLYSEINGIKGPQLRFSINGYTYGNLPGLDVCLNDHVVWYIMTVGSELDVHTVTFDGNTFTEHGTHRDGRHMVPGDTATLSMTPDNEGRWMLYSQSNLARENGMFAFYHVHNCGAKPDKVKGRQGKVREYFISADEVLWDYSPLPRSIITGADLNNVSTAGSIFFRHDENFIGHVYKKVVYREYTDGSFRTLKTGSSHDLLGPALTVEVGDTLVVTFRNNARRPYSIHTHGLWTRQKDSGVNYGSSSGVLPGRKQQYVWSIPDRAGPGLNDPNCIPWLYYSSIDPVKDTNSGLVGSLIVCRKGVLNERGQRKDVDRELFIYMSVTNENLSWYLEENVRDFAPARLGTNYQEDEDFVESNKMHSINGRIHGNNNGLVIHYGQKVVWYMMALGAEIDLHTIHLHGHTFVHSSEKHRDDVISIFPGMAEAVEMIADNPGTWLLHCHVSDHIFAGMETVYTVLPPH